MDDVVPIIKAGYLHVKLPAGVRGIGKAWTHRWVIVKPFRVTEAQKISTGILFEILKSDKAATTPKTPPVCTPENVPLQAASQVAHKRHVSTEGALFLRSYSRKQSYAFTAAEGNEPIIHLAGNSETETQQWMAALRNALWPPSQLVQLEKVLSGSLFEVSFIDNNFSHQASLLGCYGYLSISGTKITLFCPPTGHVIQEWYLNTIKVDLVPQLSTDDTNKVFTMETAKASCTGHSKFLIFSSEAETIVKNICQMQSNSGKCPTSNYQDDLTEMALFWPSQPPQLAELSSTANLPPDDVNLRPRPPDDSTQQQTNKERPVSDSCVECELYRKKPERLCSSEGASVKSVPIDDGTYAVPPRPHSIFDYSAHPSSRRDFLHLPDKLLNCSLSATMLNSENYHGRTSSNSSQETSSTPPSPTERPLDWDDHFACEMHEPHRQDCVEEVHYDAPKSLKTVDDHQCSIHVCGSDVHNKKLMDEQILERKESTDSLSDLPKSRTGSNTSNESHVYIEVPLEVNREKRPSVVTLYEEVSEDENFPAIQASAMQPPLPPRPQSLPLQNAYGTDADSKESPTSTGSTHKHTWKLKKLIRRNKHAHSEKESPESKQCNGQTKVSGIASALKVSTETIGAGLFRNNSKKPVIKRVESAPAVGQHPPECTNLSNNASSNNDDDADTKSVQSHQEEVHPKINRFRSHTWPPRTEPKQRGNMQRYGKKRTNTTDGEVIKNHQSEINLQQPNNNKLSSLQNAVHSETHNGGDDSVPSEYCYMKPGAIESHSGLNVVRKEILTRIVNTMQQNGSVEDGKLNCREESEYIDMKSAVCHNEIKC